jgi:D-alanyl-D-alanine carboxypeptidase (penicillin-binding protein 5/6)
MNEPARRASYVLAGFAASLSVIAAPGLAAATAPAAPLPDLRVPTWEPRYAAIVMDARTGDVLYEKRSDSPRYPASITKIMTLYLAFEALATGKLKESDLVVVSPRAAAQAPTKLGLRPGETITVENAMHAIAVKSANDMAVALAEKIGGSEERFAALMTLKAQELGMTRTRYVNANGLPDNRQITTAHDIATLCRAVLRDYPQYYHYFSQEQFTYRGMTMNNHNGLLGRMPGVDGFKTGFTNAAGFNLAASAVRNGQRLIAVELGGATGGQRNANVEDLLLTGFDVMERRGRGESIQLADNLFEGPPPPKFISQQAAQGDGDPIGVVLTAASHGAPVTVVSAASTPLGAHPSLVADLGAHHAFATNVPPVSAEAARSWTVQVGVFRSGRQATRQVDFIATRFKDQFDDREGEVDHSGRQYRAVFSGFTQGEARDACTAVQARNVPCAVTPTK